MYVRFYIHFDVTIRFGIVFEGFLEFLGVGHAFRLTTSPQRCRFCLGVHFVARPCMYVLPSKYRANTGLRPKTDGRNDCFSDRLFTEL